MRAEVQGVEEGQARDELQELEVLDHLGELELGSDDDDGQQAGWRIVYMTK